MGLGFAVVFVLTLTCPLNFAIHKFLLQEGALSWTGVDALANLDLSFLNFICFIADQFFWKAQISKKKAELPFGISYHRA